jgi:hypothetical protein
MFGWSRFTFPTQIGRVWLVIFDIPNPHFACLPGQAIAPKEASIWFQMGKIYKRLQRLDDAMSHFCTALDLKPSSTDVNLIKSAIEKMKVSDSSEDEEI